MLVLSRKTGQKILVGKNIIITVVRIDQGIARIGIEAPKDIAIVREELLEAREKAREPTAFCQEQGDIA